MLTWSPSFQSLPLPDFTIEAKDPSRVTLVDCARTGQKALKLTTQPGDNHIANSGAMERCDAYQHHPGTDGAVIYGNGISQWWAHSIMLPDDFQAPAGPSYVLADFHNTGQSMAATFQVSLVNWNGDRAKLGQLQLQRFIGDPMSPTEHSVAVGMPQRNVWYDFLYHVRWSDKSDGYFDAWVNGQLVMTHRGATLFQGQGVYLKLANYWAPNGFASSVIHDRLRLGTTRASVEFT